MPSNISHGILQILNPDHSGHTIKQPTLNSRHKSELAGPKAKIHQSLRVQQLDADGMSSDGGWLRRRCGGCHRALRECHNTWQQPAAVALANNGCSFHRQPRCQREELTVLRNVRKTTWYPNTSYNNHRDVPTRYTATIMMVLLHTATIMMVLLTTDSATQRHVQRWTVDKLSRKHNSHQSTSSKRSIICTSNVNIL